MIAGGADIVMLNAYSERALRGDNHSVTRSVLNGRAQDGFCGATGIDIRAVEHVDARLQTDIDETTRLVHIGRAPGLEEFTFAAKRACTKAKNRHREARCTQTPKFHDNCLHRKNRARY